MSQDIERCNQNRITWNNPLTPSVAQGGLISVVPRNASPDSSDLASSCARLINVDTVRPSRTR